MKINGKNIVKVAGKKGSLFRQIILSLLIIISGGIFFTFCCIIKKRSKGDFN